MTITKENHKGLQEVLTAVGFRSRESVKKYNLEIMHFDSKSGSEKVHELRKKCRLPRVKKSIILNHS